MVKPRLVVFAGPNGSGKSTITDKYDLKGINYINPDEIAKSKNISNLEAAQEAAKQRDDALKNGKSFAFETVLSMPDKIEQMAEAKNNGFHVLLIYVTTQSSDINLQRVEDRVNAGGHNVPPEKIIETAIRERVDAIGLSGLITPSLDEMVYLAKEMQRQNFEIPLLIGGATTSKAHTAVKIEPRYKNDATVYVADASRSVAVATQLISQDLKAAFVAERKDE